LSLPNVIETERLILRRYALSDLDALYEVFADPEARQFYPEMVARERVLGWIEWNLRNYDETGFGLWAMEPRGESRLIGDCGLTYQEVNGRQELEIGYHVHARERGKGYATEAARACLAYAFRSSTRRWSAPSSARRTPPPAPSPAASTGTAGSSSNPAVPPFCSLRNEGDCRNPGAVSRRVPNGSLPLSDNFSYCVGQQRRIATMAGKAKKTQTKTAASAAERHHGRAAAGRTMPAKFSERLVVLKEAAGVVKDKKTQRIGGRISPKLVALVRRKTGIHSDTDLIEAGLLTLAAEDDFGRWLIAQAGRLDKDLELGL
jgi:hypothetical protein